MNFVLPFIIFILTLLVSCEEKNDPKSHNLLQKGVSHLEKNESIEALRYFKYALSLKISSHMEAVLYRNMSIAYQNNGKLDSAIICSQKGYEIAPSDSYLFYINRAEYNILTNDIHTAILDLKNAKLISPDQMEIYQTLCLIYSGEYGDAYFDPELSEFCAKKSFQLKPSNTTKEQLGSIYFQNEKYVKAVAIFTELYSKEPTNKKYEFYLGQSLYFAGDERGGENHMKKASERDEECKAMYHEIFEIGQHLD